MLGIEVPIIQAPMITAATAELVAAVSNAGGLGSLGSAMYSVEEMKVQASKLRSLTNKPFNLNFFVHSEPDLTHYDPKPMQAALSPLYKELQLGEVPAPRSPAPAFNDEMLACVLELQPKIVSFHFGLPNESAMRALKQAGIIILSSATTVAEARHLETHGADAIIAQGSEAGGHRGTFLESDANGTIGTMALVPLVVDAVKVPVIAAGGIMDGRGIAAAIMLGASAAQLGTAFLACPEASMHPVHRQALKNTSGEQTIVTRIFSGRPARAIRNRLTDTMEANEHLAAPYPTQRALVAPLTQESAKRNDPSFMQLWAGEAAALVKEEPAAEKIARLWRETEALLNNR
jgi:nitronate monooxygenase